VLRFIEWRWGLEPLTERDATANNLAEALDFRRPRKKAPRYAVPRGPHAALCLPFEADKWTAMRNLALGLGWPLELFQ
jgi:phospholipase C